MTISSLGLQGEARSKTFRFDLFMFSAAQSSIVRGWLWDVFAGALFGFCMLVVLSAGVGADEKPLVPDSDLKGPEMPASSEKGEVQGGVEGGVGNNSQGQPAGEPPSGAGTDEVSFGGQQGLVLGLPEVPLPMASPVLEDGWSVDDGLFPSGMDFLRLVTPEISLLDTGDAEVFEVDRAKISQVSRALVQLGLKIAPAVVTLRAWNEFGEELASGSGFFVSGTGMVLTDMAIVHPEISEEIDFISVMSGDGTGYRITGVWDRDTVQGTALLQTDGKDTPYLKINREGAVGADGTPVTILAVHDTRGLILADASMSLDEERSGEGWFIVQGQESPGAVGSPVLDRNGDVVAMIAMQLPIENWVNFAIPIDAAATKIEELGGGAPVAISKITGGRWDIDLSRNQRFIEAYGDLNEGSYRRAALGLTKLAKRYPRSAACWGLLGLAVAKLGAWEEALNCQRRAVALDPSLDESWYQLALASLNVKDGLPLSAAARESLENTVRARPADRFAWLLLAQSYIEEEDYENANISLEQVIKLEPDFSQAHFLLGFVRGKLGDLGMAENAMRRSLELYHRNSKGWFYLGLLYTEQGRREEAAEAFRTVVEFEPEHSHAWLNLAHVLKEQGKRTEARTAFLKHQSLETKPRG